VSVDFRKMCDKCRRLLSDNEPMMAFKLIDDNDFAVVFKGHDACMKQLFEELQQIYGGFSEERKNNE
jgi:hypothetical protein